MNKFVLRIFISLLSGSAVSAAMLMKFFANYDGYAALDRFFLQFIPAASIAILVYYFFPFLEKPFIEAGTFTHIFLTASALICVFIAELSLTGASIALYISSGISIFIICLSVLIPSAPYLQRIFEQKQYFRLFGGWLLSTLILFIPLGILDNYYNAPFEFAALIILCQLAGGLAGWYLAGRIERFYKKSTLDFSFVIIIFLLPAIFSISIFKMGNQFPKLFSADAFLIRGSLYPLYLIVSILAIPWQARMLNILRAREWISKFKGTKIYAFIHANLAGILLGSVFLSIYTVTASILNNPHFDVDDVFFDADTLNWRLRLTSDHWQDYYWRSVHPFVLLLLKPPIDLIALFLKGDKLFSAFIVVALGGALCVFLAWRYVEKVTGSTIFALLIASLLGLSASHLLFGSLIETYIFLAASLLLFHLLLLEESPLPPLILSSLMTIGLTYTNFAQNALALFAVRPNFKLILRYVASVITLLVLLSLLNNLLYPGAHPFFFVPSALLAEKQNIFPLNPLRIEALVRAFFFQNVVAPTPILYNGDIPFTQFRFFKPEINKLSNYHLSLQKFTAWFWLALILLGVILFIINIKKYKTNRFSLALMGCMVMNVAINLRYGKELFLYSPNWTYALILVLALAWQKLADARWFQITLMIFLVFLMLNNGLLLNHIFDVLAAQFN